MRKELQNLIKELRYAQKIHLERAVDLTLPKNERIREKRINRQKEMVIQILQGKIFVEEKYIRIVKRWRNIHLNWIEYINYHKNPSKKIQEDINKRGGSIHWNKRWIRVYNRVLDCLNKLKNK